MGCVNCQAVLWAMLRGSFAIRLHAPNEVPWASHLPLPLLQQSLLQETLKLLLLGIKCCLKGAIKKWN